MVILQRLAWSRTHLRNELAGCLCRCLVAELNKSKALAFLGARMSAHMQRSRHQAVCAGARRSWLLQIALQLLRRRVHSLQ